MGTDASAPSPPANLPHVAIFPFMSKGHTIPLLHLARLLHRRRLATFTFFTTPLNAPFIRRSLADVDGDVAVLELPFPHDALGLPPGVESTDQLPSMSLLLPFFAAVEGLQPDFERALGGLRPRASFLISDGFHSWTVESARKVGVPRLEFFGMGVYASAAVEVAVTTRPHAGVASQSESFSVPGFPTLRFTKADLPVECEDPDRHGASYENIKRTLRARGDSRGIIFNTSYEMESNCVDYWRGHVRPKAAWCVGPLCLAQPPGQSLLRQEYVDWLGARLGEKRPVLYVAFGSQVELAPLQIEELAAGLERSGLDFLWALRSREGTVGDVPFQKTAAGRGLVVREWVPQTEVLGHAAVRGFLSHCGWNSVLESVCAGVPLLAWPVMGDQHLNARMVAEELGIGIRVRAADGTRGGLVGRECIEEAVRELLVGEKGRQARARAAELGGAAREAMEEGGSSWQALQKMVDDVCREDAGPSEDGGRRATQL